MGKKMAPSKHTPSGAAATELLRSVFLANAVLISEGDRLSRDLGLTSARWQVLGAAAGRPKSVPQLARRMSLSRQSVQRLVDLMVKSGFLRLLDNPDHVRAKLIELTEKGIKARAKLLERQIGWINNISRDMQRRELMAARSVLMKLHAACEQSAAAHPS